MVEVSPLIHSVLHHAAAEGTDEGRLGPVVPGDDLDKLHRFGMLFAKREDLVPAGSPEGVRVEVVVLWIAGRRWKVSVD